MTAKRTSVRAEAADVVFEPPPPTPSQVRLRSEAGAARQRRRSRRKRAVRGRSICVKRLTKLEIEVGRLLFPVEEFDRPATRADCVHGERPCPFVSCAHHLYLDVFAKTGAIKLNFPDLEVWEMVDSCSLDVADRGGTTLEDAGAMMNLTRERIRQVEVGALAKLEALQELTDFRDHISEGTSGKRRLPILSRRIEEEDDEEKAEDEEEAEEVEEQKTE
jgi:hypothetical protein